jgi:hypothetical protein
MEKEYDERPAPTLRQERRVESDAWPPLEDDVEASDDDQRRADADALGDVNDND